MSYAIITAGGKGSRFAGALPKQLFRINGRTLLGWAAFPFQQEGEIQKVILVYPSDEDPEIYEKILREEGITKGELAPGGPTRFASVRNGFQKIQNADPASAVLIHDAARPLVSPELIRRVLHGIHKRGTAIPVLAVHETVKQVEDDQIVRTIPRDQLFVSQTPQGFRYSILKLAYESANAEREITDESALVELTGIPVHAVNGERENLKITDLSDIPLLEFYLGRRSS